MCKSKAILNGKVAVVTGGGAGIGFDAAKDLARQGARVIIASRNATTLERARDQIQAETGNPNVHYKVLDLTSFKSVRRFTQEMTQECRLDMLINNAGGYGLPEQLTEDGLSLMMQVNFFGAFLLTYLLLPMLRFSAPSRIINSSAISMYIGDIDFDHWNDVGRYSIPTASGNAKLAAALITAEWARRMKGTGVVANSFDPFFVKDTGITNYLSKEQRATSDVFIELVGRPREEVGQQISFYASAPELENVTGAHFKFCKRWPNHWYEQNLQLRRRLWEESKKLVGITPDEDWEVHGFHHHALCT